jgi:hypothetical protein
LTYWVRLVLCDILGWHRPDPGAETWFDGLNVRASCLRCGYHGMIDSQGNLF